VFFHCVYLHTESLGYFSVALSARDLVRYGNFGWGKTKPPDSGPDRGYARSAANGGQRESWGYKSAAMWTRIGHFMPVLLCGPGEG
jgi:hypothetical protein